jgi:hypothetical protein
MTEIPDVIGAVRQHLLADSALNTLVSGRIYGQELPRDQNQYMPRKAVVIRSSGGPAQMGTIPVGDVRIDFRCYGESPLEAMKVFRTVFPRMKFGTMRKAYGSALLHSARQDSGPINLLEPDVEWPFQFSAWMVKMAEIPISA